MPPKITNKKKEIQIPSEPRQLCKWTEEDIKSSLSIKDENGRLLSQDLYSASHDLYQSNKIRQLGLQQTSSFDETNKILLKNKKNTNAPSLRRFIVDIGHKKRHEDSFRTRVYKSETEYHESFREMIISHYKWCFAPGEDVHITKAIDRDDVCHLVIYNRFYRRLKRNKKDSKDDTVEPCYFVAAAASFLISDTCSVLLYMGVSLDQFMPKSDFLKEENEGKKSKPLFTNYRQNDLGMYMISMVQKMTFSAIGHHSIVAEVNNHPSIGAIYFYLKSYFKIVHKHHNQICEINSKFDGVFINTTGLVYMISRCPLYLIYPSFMKDAINIESMKEAIIFGAKNILDVEIGTNEIQSQSTIIDNELKECLIKLQNENDAFICNLNEDLTNTITKNKKKNYAD